MNYALETSDYFLRRARKFFRKHPDLKSKFAKVTETLCDDPFAVSLKTHNLSGDLEGIYAISLTHSYRVTLLLKITEKEIILLDIGSHDEVYRS
ncbi:MAG: type II toxin-antitoxin system mRNA interferase toxin, RelE/StbE family [Methylococcaceae bacterium]|nr:type II toxin-antitoxin system mRNA interferase toxin, RelE/StbE family [Methylococcaceae bacterium]